MQIIHNLSEWITIRSALATQSIGFVPTMGNLHIGHDSLYKASRHENTCTIASLFINPAQFNQRNDFIYYPRTLETDLQRLDELGVDYCILPTEQDMYAEGYRYQIHETELCKQMEGASRPGHFTGVLTVVMKLLNLVKPHCAYFGEKDYQQYCLIRDMADAFFMGTTIKALPTIREASGLAYSSRNNRLTPEQRLIAEKFAQIFHQKNKSCETLIDELKHHLIQVDYIKEYENRRFAAVIIGEVRLIDNYALFS